MSNRQLTPASKSGAIAVGALALGALAVGALAIGALAIGALKIGKMYLRKGQIKDLHIERLTIGHLAIQSTQRPGKVPARHCNRSLILMREPRESSEALRCSGVTTLRTFFRFFREATQRSR